MLNYKQVALLLLLQRGAHRTLNKGVQDSKRNLPVSKKLHNSASATSSLSPHLCDKFCIPQAFVKDLILHGTGCPLYLQVSGEAEELVTLQDKDLPERIQT